VLADDLGYSNARCYDPQHAKVATPHVDRLAREGMLFTDAHAAASLCSPSRSSLLTVRFLLHPSSVFILSFSSSPAQTNRSLKVPTVSHTISAGFAGIVEIDFHNFCLNRASPARRR
jgi:arylsulfatase A-like enzyme